ncbi:MAG: phage major capsid protein, partial [Selenomonadaceae bacterium]|nr:phage major capsid protein [Selenomonadaceae bacterium]
GDYELTIAATKPAAAWIAEGQQITFSNATFSQKTLKAYKLAVGVQVTNELLTDSMFNLESYILDQFGKTISNAEEDKFINGTGGANNQPSGILKDAQVGVTTNSTTAITSDEIINLVYSLKRPYRKNASFIMNDSILAAIRKLKDNTQNYLWQPSFAADEPDRLLGYPIYTSSYVPTIAAEAKVIIFGDISYYNIGDRGARTFQELKEVYAPNFMTGYLMSERVDGILVLPEAVQVLQMRA